MRCDLCLKDTKVKMVNLVVYGKKNLEICEACEKHLVAVVTAIGALTVNAYRQAVGELGSRVHKTRES